MKVAIPCWVGRVSPVFDVAARLILVDVESYQEVGRTEQVLECFDFGDRVSLLEEMGVTTLICGAISEELTRLLSAKGIEVSEGICGDVNEILNAFLSGSLGDRKFALPGYTPAVSCCPPRR